MAKKDYWNIALKPIEYMLFVYLGFNICLLLFLVGFFPIENGENEKADFQSLPNNLKNIRFNKTSYKNHFSKVILMVIDALRFDFVSNHNTPYLVNKLQKNYGYKFQMIADAPTVTLSKVKTIITGTISNFVDIILNLGSPEISGDNLLHQMYERGDKIVFYGDITWNKLFPNIFHRKDITDTYFMNDFYEADYNITKGLETELTNLDWDFLILHYSGLDHIGHVEDSFSEKIHHKLKEMDMVVEKIDNNLDSLKIASPLFIVTADHGMRDAGSHGGGTTSEILIPFIALMKICNRDKNCSEDKKLHNLYNQIDITPTLAVLLGLPIPARSIGCLISELIDILDETDQLFAYYYNTGNLVKKFKTKFGEKEFENKDGIIKFKKAMKYHYKFLVSNEPFNENNLKNDFELAKMEYIASAKQLSNELRKYYVHFDMLQIILGISMAFFNIIALMKVSYYTPKFVTINLKKLFIAVIAFFLFGVVSVNIICNALQVNSSTCTNDITSLALLLTLSCSFSVCWVCSFHQNKIYSNVCLLVFLCSLPNAISLISSSFIEEEHQFWYYITSTGFLILFAKEFFNLRKSNGNLIPTSLKSSKILTKSTNNRLKLWSIINLKEFSALQQRVVSWITLFLIHLFIRRLNKNGDKWIALPDIADWFAEKDNRIYLVFFFLTGLICLFLTTFKMNNFCTNTLFVIALGLIYIFRIKESLTSESNKNNSDSILYCFWINIFGILLLNYIPFLRKFFQGTLTRKHRNFISEVNIFIFNLFSALLHKPHNVCLLPTCIYTMRNVFYSCNTAVKNKNKIIWKIIFSYYIGMTFFFYQGNSNSLATIDINPGYIGLSSYNVTIAAFLITLNTYSGPIGCFLILLHEIYKDEKTGESETSLELLVLTTSIIILLPTAIYMIIMVFMRFHLFIMSVFSPKMVYISFSCILYFFLLFINVLFSKLVNRSI